MRQEVTPLTASEMAFIQSAFQAHPKNGGLNEYGKVEFTHDGQRMAWIGICSKVRKTALKEVDLIWGRVLANKVITVWFTGESKTVIANELDVDVAQPGRWLKNGIPLEPLLRAIYQTGRCDQPLPHPSDSLRKRTILPGAIRQFCSWFQQAGVWADKGRPHLSPWQIEIFLNVFDKHQEWRAAEGRAAAARNQIDVLSPLADATIAAVFAALKDDGHDDSDLNPLHDLTSSPQRAVATCLEYHNDDPTRLAYGWAINAAHDERLFDFN